MNHEHKPADGAIHSSSPSSVTDLKNGSLHIFASVSEKGYDPTTTKIAMDGIDWRPTRQIWLIIAGQTCCVFVVCLDATILTTALPTVARALDANASTAFWIVASYLLASAVVQPITATISDVFGRRSTFLAGLLFFTAGTVICALAQRVNMMLAGRTIQGIGGGTILSVNLIILSDIIPLRQRSKYVGIVQAFNSVAVNLGPIIGALLIKSSWRWLFFVNLPFCAVGFVVVPFLLRYVKPMTSAAEKLGEIDWIGSLLFMIGMTGFLVGVSWGGSQYTWHSAATLAPLLGGLAMLVLTGLYERFVASRPFFRLSLFHSWSAAAVHACAVLQNLTLFCEVYFISLALLTTKLFSPIVTGVALLAFAFTVVPVSAIVGTIITSMGSYRWAILSGWLVNTLGLGALMVIGPDLYTPGMIFVFLVAGAGQGILFMGHQIATQASAKVKDVAYASAIFSFDRSLGFSLGVALGGTIFQNFLKQRLSLVGLPVEIAHHAEEYASVLVALPAGLEKTAIIAAYTWSFRMLFAVMTGISALGLSLSFLVKEYSLDLELESEHVLKSGDVSREMLGRARVIDGDASA